MSARTIVFRTFPIEENRAEYYALAAELFKLAAGMPGFVAGKTFIAPDGEELTMVEFASDEALNAWRRNAEHLTAQKSTARFFANYRITVFGDPIREYGIEGQRPRPK